MSPLSQVLDAIDLLNSEDPNSEQADGVVRLKEQLFCLWTSKRPDYPEGRAGYYQWRIGLEKMHAQIAVDQMVKAGCSEEPRHRVFQPIMLRAQ